MGDFGIEAKKYSITNFKPLRGQVLVQTERGEEITKGGIIIPETAREKTCVGTVCKVGLDIITNWGVKIPITLKEKDVIVFSRYAGQEISFKETEEEFRLVKIEHVFGVFEEEEGIVYE